MYSETNYLVHYGKLGMRWGKRMNSVLSGGASVSREGGNLARSLGKFSKNKDKTDITKISDDDLRKKVNRMGLEQQYKNLSAQQTKKGSDKVAHMLEIAGSVLTIGASAVTVAVGIKSLTRKSGFAGPAKLVGKMVWKKKG